MTISEIIKVTGIAYKALSDVYRYGHESDEMLARFSHGEQIDAAALNDALEKSMKAYRKYKKTIAKMDDDARAIIINNGPLSEEEFIRKWLEMKG